VEALSCATPGGSRCSLSPPRDLAHDWVADGTVPDALYVLI
jgi:hypothetical protein